MQFQIEHKDLLDAISRTNGVVDKKNTIPVLSNQLFDIDAATQRVTVTATNLEIGMQTIAPCQTMESFSITIPAQKLFEIVRELPEATVTLTIDEKNWITIECLKANFRLAGLPKADFPALPSLAEDCDVRVTAPGTIFRDGIGHVAFAVSHDESRFALTGVLFEFEPERLLLIATDGHRLAKHSQPATCVLADGLPESGKHVILPLRAVMEMKKLCASSDATLTVTPNQAVFQTGDTLLVTRRIDAQFPDYRQVIPTDSRFALVANREECSRALRRVALLCSDTHLVKFHLSEHLLTLSSNDPSLGEAREVVPVEYSGEEMAIGFNARYIMDFLSVISGNELRVNVNDALSPGLFSSTDTQDAGFACVVMPMRV